MQDEQPIIVGGGLPIDDILARMSESELRDLHRKSGERLRLIYNIRQAQALTRFNRGDRVIFQNNERNIAGTVTKLNRKTVSIHTDDHADWNVMPSHLNKLVEN